MTIKEEIKKKKEENPEKWGMETTYDGIEMRSRLETNIAYILDMMDIEWEYEPKSFRLKNGMTYIPDFYLPELDTWIEGKGVMKEKDKRQHHQFVKEDHELVVMMREGLIFESVYAPSHGSIEEQHLQLGKCKDCGSYFFCGMYGSYHCRSCGTHNGDHDIIYLFERENEWMIDESPDSNVKRPLNKLEEIIENREK